MNVVKISEMEQMPGGNTKIVMESQIFAIMSRFHWLVQQEGDGELDWSGVEELTVPLAHMLFIFMREYWKTSLPQILMRIRLVKLKPEVNTALNEGFRIVMNELDVKKAKKRIFTNATMPEIYNTSPVATVPRDRVLHASRYDTIGDLENIQAMRRMPRPPLPKPETILDGSEYPKDIQDVLQQYGIEEGEWEPDNGEPPLWQPEDEFTDDPGSQWDWDNPDIFAELEHLLIADESPVDIMNCDVCGATLYALEPHTYEISDELILCRECAKRDS